MSNLMLFRTVRFEQFRECSEGTHFLTYKMIKNIKLPVKFRRESSVSISYHSFRNRENEMLTDLLSESCKEGGNFSVG